MPDGSFKLGERIDLFEVEKKRRLFGEDCVVDEYQSYVFASDKVDYMTNQGYRFIIQFYPLGFLPELREE